MSTPWPGGSAGRRRRRGPCRARKPWHFDSFRVSCRRSPRPGRGPGPGRARTGRLDGRRPGSAARTGGGRPLPRRPADPRASGRARPSSARRSTPRNSWRGTAFRLPVSRVRDARAGARRGRRATIRVSRRRQGRRTGRRQGRGRRRDDAEAEAAVRAAMVDRTVWRRRRTARHRRVPDGPEVSFFPVRRRHARAAGHRPGSQADLGRRPRTEHRRDGGVRARVR